MSPEPKDLLTVGEVAARTGVAPSALRFYEAEGLITAERNGGNQRMYRRHMLRRISLILAARRLGIPLAEVAVVFGTLPADRAPSHRDWVRVSRVWKSELEDRRRYIMNLERQLIACIGCGCLSMRSCDLLNPADELGTRGQGPVRLDEPD
ncbi:redox-sensitive transcriptional activator SoxR [Dactylosporangium siamense]|uniref:Redox-sensitive transcriptional activator SoxR n=1 Tax=Dactylosporangium siamense TaxID=685454 RepID=A0A919PSK3_9ACTN|nr:redox-sensitive transcriptional activator SoxR [Dactylosporangium siamense]GIG50115.1 redox-sensitive transcriptional activator SoxR [Dactylosporangium siamense]